MEMFQIIVCLLIYLVILGGNFNVNFLGLLNETNLLLNEFDPLLILYSYRFAPRKRKVFITDALLIFLFLAFCRCTEHENENEFVSI